MKQIGIIGAGAAGLCALRHCLALKGISVTAFEIQADVGGTWLYSPNIGTDEYGNSIHSSMYRSLRTNLPKEIMKFPDYPFAPHDKSYVPHSDVLGYLKNYARDFNLYPHIKLRHKVESIEPFPSNESGASRWKVCVTNLAEKTTSFNIYDYIFICNGHLSIPNVAQIPNIDNFSGTRMHSHYYREPSSYKNRSIVVLGAKSSGLDISMELSSVAKEVFICHNLADPNSSKVPSNVSQRSGIKEATEDGFILMDGSQIKADSLLYCTGYLFSFPFLNSSCGIGIDNKVIKHLYRGMINAKFPSMFFIGIHVDILPFPLFDIQIRFCLQSVTESLKLPSCAEMLADIETKYQNHLSEGPHHHFHRLSSKQWKYSADLAQEAKLVPLEGFYELIYKDSHAQRTTKLSVYQENVYTITGPDSFHCHYKQTE